MKTLIPAAIRCSLMFTAVAALSLAYPTSVQAVPTKYHYTGNPFTEVEPPYTKDMFVTAMVTLAAPLGANMPLTTVTPTAFTLTDGVQTISNHNAFEFFFQFATDASGDITAWRVFVEAHFGGKLIETHHDDPFSFPQTFDEAISTGGLAFNADSPGEWTAHVSVPDAVYHIIDDADPYGVGSSGPAVQAGSGLTAPGLAKNKSPLNVSLLGPLPGSKNTVSFSAAPFLHGHYKTKLTANSCIALSSSRNAVRISSARMMKRFP